MAHHVIIAGAPTGGYVDPVTKQRNDLRTYAMKERAEVRKLRLEGKCDGMNKPQCYETCEHSYWCSELQHIIHLPY